MKNWVLVFLLSFFLVLISRTWQSCSMHARIDCFSCVAKKSPLTLLLPSPPSPPLSSPSSKANLKRRSPTRQKEVPSRPPPSSRGFYQSKRRGRLNEEVNSFQSKVFLGILLGPFFSPRASRPVLSFLLCSNLSAWPEKLKKLTSGQRGKWKTLKTKKTKNIYWLHIT